MTPRRLAAISRWLRHQAKKSKRFGYCAQETALYLTDKLFNLSVMVTLDVWIEKSFSFAEVEVLCQSEKTMVSVSL